MQLDFIIKSYLFSPDKELWATPGDAGIPYEDVYFKTEDGLELNGWYIKSGEENPTIFFFHGSDGNISNRITHIRLLRKLELNVFILDYRGYGHSQGEVSEEGIYKDSNVAYHYLKSRKDLNPRKIFPFGESMGGAVAIDLACKHKFPLVIVQSVATSMEALFKGEMDSNFPGMFDSLSKIKFIKSPLLIIHGDRDEVVPYKLGRELFKAANRPKEFYRIKGADHNNTFDVAGDEYFERIRKFVLKYLPDRSP